jgi:hypothetical protein
VERQGSGDESHNGETSQGDFESVSAEVKGRTIG